MTDKYICSKCGTAVDLIYKGLCIPSCCGKEMDLIHPKTGDSSKEKHVPYIERVNGGILIKVGKESAHPMTCDHYIVFIQAQVDDMIIKKYLKPGDIPEAFFKIDSSNVIAWAYCNKHGLWKSNQ